MLCLKDAIRFSCSSVSIGPSSESDLRPPYFKFWTRLNRGIKSNNIYLKRTMANPEIVKKKEGQGHNRETETFCVRDMKIY